MYYSARMLYYGCPIKRVVWGWAPLCQTRMSPLWLAALEVKSATHIRRICAFCRYCFVFISQSIYLAPIAVICRSVLRRLLHALMPSASDDSLVFAESGRAADQDTDVDQSSPLFDRVYPEANFRSLQIHSNSTTRLLHEKSTDSARPSTIAFSSDSHIPVVTRYDDTQVIGRSTRRPSGTFIEYGGIPSPESAPRYERGNANESEFAHDTTNADISKDSGSSPYGEESSLVFNSSREENHKRRDLGAIEPGIPEFAAEDTQADGGIDAARPGDTTADTQIIRIPATDDTQVIQRTGNNRAHMNLPSTLAEDQELIKGNQTDLDNEIQVNQNGKVSRLADTQVVQRVTENAETTLHEGSEPSADAATRSYATQADTGASASSHNSASHSLTLHDPFSSPKAEKHAEIVSTSPLFEPRAMHGWTEVPNTQEEYIESESGLIDLAARPIYSSSQNERADVSIVSVDDGEALYEDSLVHHKRRRPNRQVLSYESASLNEMDEAEASSSGKAEQTRSESIANSVSSPSSLELEDFSHDPLGDIEQVGVVFTVPETERQISLALTPPDFCTQDPETLSASEINDCNAVWAFSEFKFFCARVLSYDDTELWVEFCDLKQQTVKTNDLLPLDIRVGDIVHVITRVGDFVVTCLSRNSTPSTFHCFRGFTHVELAKKGKHGLPAGLRFVIPISDVFLTMDQWILHQQKFGICDETKKDILQQNYAVLRRAILGNLLTAIAQVSPRKSTQPTKSSALAGMFFCVTLLDENRKLQLGELIASHEGTLLEVEIERMAMRVDISDKPEGGNSKSGAAHHLGLRCSSLTNYTFGALLSDGESRSPKYLQALALGWPILAFAYVEAAIKSPELRRNWHLYLLPAGRSHYTNTLVSMNVLKFLRKHLLGVSMNSQWDNNCHLMRDYDVVVVLMKQDPKQLGMSEFVFHAFGVRSIRYLNTVREVEEHVPGDRCVVYDNLARDYQKKGFNRTIAWEWVVQCVIHNYIWPFGAST